MKTKTKTKQAEDSKLTIIWDDEVKTTAEKVQANIDSLKLIVLALFGLNVVILIGAILHR
jgi:hypothetical protein